MNIFKLLIISLLSVVLLYGCSSDINVEEKGKKDSTTKVNGTKKQKVKDEKYSAEKLENKLKENDLIIQNSQYLVQSEDMKSLYPDILSTVVKNKSNKDIKNISIGYVAWDSNGLPVKIKGKIDFSGGAYYRFGNGEGVNIPPGGTFGENRGLELSEDTNINSFKPIIISYEDFEGHKWKNKNLESFRKIYEGKRLKDIPKYEEYIYYKNNQQRR
nr:DUF5780 domain-containing protein [Mammaliicoccus sp. Marseille-Q6498]